MIVRILVLMVFVGGGANTLASTGGDEPEGYYISRDRPDIDLDAYQSGKLGIIQPGYPRIFLYPAWRAIMVGQEGLKKEPVQVGMLKKFCCDQNAGWIDEHDARIPKARWAALRATITSVLPTVRLSAESRDEKNPYRYFQSCTGESYRFAEATLTQLKKRSDATPERLREWVAGQDKVYEFCGRLDTMVGSAEPPHYPVPLVVPALVIPPQLSTDTPIIWQQYREYQRAAAMFYSGDNHQAAVLFNSIGNQDGHPMQIWGEYLALRAKIREAYLSHLPADPSLAHRQFQPLTRDGFEVFKNDIADDGAAEIIKSTEKITGNPNLKEVHELARASLRAFKYKTMPHKQFMALSEKLNHHQQDPNIDDVLGDWRRLANYFLDNNYGGSVEKKPPLIQAMRTKYTFFDWIQTVQNCSASRAQEDKVACKDEASHALAQWRQAKSTNNSPAERVWLVAVLITTDQLTEEIKSQAEMVADTAPEYLTVRYNLARLLRLSGNRDKASALLDGEIKKSFESHSALNLFLQERFASASSLEDASKFLFRNIVGELNFDTKEVTFGKMKNPSVADDGARWINHNLSINDLLSLAGLPSLPINLRIQLAGIAWLRADLLGKNGLANLAANKVIQLSSTMKKPVNDYLHAKNPMLRRHALLLAAVNQGVSTIITSEEIGSKLYMTNKTTYFSEHVCCSLSEAENIYYSMAYLPEPPQVSAEPEIRDTEISQLTKIKLGNRYFAGHLLVYAAAYPNDPQIPELLSRVINSNKYSGSCSPDEKDCKVEFRRCFELLHKKYGKTKWALETRYWH